MKLFFIRNENQTDISFKDKITSILKIPFFFSFGKNYQMQCLCRGTRSSLLCQNNPRIFKNKELNHTLLCEEESLYIANCEDSVIESIHDFTFIPRSNLINSMIS